MDNQPPAFNDSNTGGEMLDTGMSTTSFTPATPPPVSSPVTSPISRVNVNRRALIITGSIGAAVAVFLIGALGLLLTSNAKNHNSSSPLSSYNSTSTPLSSANGVSQLPVNSAQTLAVNGQLQVNKSLVLSPTTTPSAPVLGEIYYNSATNTPYYYNGSSFVTFTPTPTTVGGASGAITLGNGLTVSNNQLGVSSSLLQSVTNGLTPKVSSVQGQTGNVNFIAGNGITLNGTTIGVDGATLTSQVLGSLQAGNGIGVSGGQITNTGVVALTSTGNSIKITPQGNGIFDLEASNGGSGGVVSISSNDSSIAVTNDGTGNYNVQIATNGVVAGSYGTASTAAVFTVNAAGQVTSASTVPIALNGNQITSGKIGNTYLNTDVALYDNATSNFTGALQQGGYNVCTTNGNCVGVPGGSIGGSGTSGALAMFTGLGYTIGNSYLTQTSGNLTDSGNLDIQGTGGLTIGSGSATVTLKAAASGTPVLTLPSSVGMSGQCLITDGTGALSFSSCLSGSSGGSGGVSSLNGMSGALTLTQGTGLSIANGTNSISFALANTTVTPNSYGSASSVATYTVNAQGQLTAAGNTQIAINGNQITSGTIGDAYLSSNVALYGNTTSNFTGALQQNGNGVCTTAGNCTGVAGGSVGGSGTNGVLPVFTGTGYTIGDSVLSQSNGDLTDNGYLQIAGAGGLILGTGTATTSIKSSSTNAITFTLPGVTGTAGQCLTTDGTGNLSFANCLSGSSGGSSGVASLNGLSGALNITQGSSISITTGASSINVGLAASGVSAGSYGSASSVATYTVNAEGQITAAGSTPIAINGNQITSGTVGDSYLSSNVALYNNTTSNFTGALQQGGYNVCTTAGNCTGVAGGGIGGSGTAGSLAIFTGSGYTVGNSALTQSSGNLTASGNLSIQGTGGLTLGTGAATTTILGSSTSAITFTLPATTGSANQCLVTDGTGTLSFANCASGGGGGGVSTLNGLSGAVSLQDSSGELTFTPSGSNIDISLPQGLSATSSPTFASLTLTNPLSIANGGTGQATAPTSGQILIGNTGGTFGLNTLTPGTGVSITNGSGAITLGLSTTAVTAGAYGDGADVATFTVNAEGQLTAAGSTAIAINGNQVTAGTISNTRLNTDVALYDNATSNFTGALQQAGNTVCTTAGNCVGVSGGGIGGSGSAGSLAMFTGSGYTVGNSALTDTSGNIIDSGNLSIQGTGGLTLGSGSSNTSIVSSSTSPLTLTLPSNAGTSGQCLTTDGTGVLSFANCLSGSSGGSGGVSSLDGLSGALTLSQGTGLSVANGVSNITLGIANTAVTAGTYGDGADVATFTVNAQGQLTAASSTPIAINGSQITAGKVGNTYLNTDVALYDNTTSNFTGALQQAGNSVCTTAGNCTGVAGGAVGGSGTAGTVALFTGSGYTIGDSLLAQATGTLTDSGNLVIQGSSGLTLGSGTSTTQLLSGSTAAITFTLPTTTGTSGQCLATDGTGVLSFTSCLTGSSGGSGGVSSLNTLSGAVTLQDTNNELTFTSTGQNINIHLPQGLATTDSPTFAGATISTGGSFTDNGSAVFKDNSNSTSAFSVQNSSSTSVLKVDTVNQYIGINNATPNAALDVVAISAPFFDGFESGSLAPFVNVSNFSIVSSGCYDGTYCATNEPVSNTGGSSSLTLTKTLSAAGNISFYADISAGCGSNSSFYIDGIQKISVSSNGNGSTNNTGWNLSTFALTSGSHTFSWDSNNGSCDSAYWIIDDVTVTNAGAASAATFNGGDVGVGTYYPGNLLSIGSLTTASSGAQVAVSTGGTTNSGVLVQEVASQSSGYGFQLQNSSGTSLASIDYQGNLVANSASLTSALGVSSGGTGISSYTQGSLLYASGTSTLAQLNDVATGQCLLSSGTTSAPTWGSCGGSNGVTGTGSSGQIALFNGSSSIAGSVLTQASSDITDSGTLLVQPSTSSVTALEVATPTNSAVFTVDTTDSVVGVGVNPNSTGSTLQVGGTLSVATLGAAGTTQLCYNATYQISSCGPGAGSGSFILNSTTLQSPANIYIQSTSPTTPTVQLEDTTSQTADLIDFEDSTGIIQSEITSSGVFEGANQTTGNNNGGNITTQGGAASGTGIGGSVVLQGGLASSTAGSNGGGVNIYGANGSTVSAGGNGGGVNIVAGNGAGTGNNNGGNITISAGGNTGTGMVGSVINKNAADSLTAFQVQDTSSSAVLDVDTTDGRVGINTTTPAYALDVNGQINSNTALSVNGVPVCTVSGCVAQGSSGSYIQNGTSVETSANFNIRSAAAASVTAIIQGASGQTADLLDTESYNGTNSTTLDSFNSNGALNIKNLANTATELTLQNAAGTTFLQVSSVSQTDVQGATDNGSIGVNGASTTAGYAVNVTGSLNATALYAGGVLVCTSTNYCTPSAQSAYYIWNNSTITQAANFKIQAASTGTVAGVLEANAAGTGNTLNLENGSGAVVDSFGSTGNVLVQPSTNSNTAFQVDNTNSTSIFNVDTAKATSNLITNSSFESSSSGWLGTNATVAQYTSGAWQGNDSLSIATTASGGYGYFTYNALAQNTQYTLSAYVKGAVATNTINLGYTYNGSATDVCTALSATTSSWLRLTCTFTTPNTASTNNANIYIKNTTSGQTVYIDGVQLQTGAAATPYNPGGGEQLNGIVESPVTLENSQNSTSAFQIQNSAGTSNLLVADTANNVIGVDLSPSSTGATLQDGGTLSVTGLSTFNGGLTIASGSTFTNSSSSLYTAASVANATVNGNIGGVSNGATTVDVATTLNVTQTTAGLTLTLPNPTITTAGRIVYINSLSGNASFTMYGISIGANTSASFIWNGSAWEVLGEGTNAATSAGVNTVGAIDTFANANGATISGTTIYLQSASASVPGLVNTSTQTFGGAKTFSSAVTLSTLGAASGSTYLCYNSSNQIAACSTGGSGGGGSGPAFMQGGNSFGAAAVLGTNDVNSLSLETDGLNQMTIAVGGAVTFKNSTDSVTGFQIQQSGGSSVLDVDTTNGRVGINTTSPAYALDVNGVINSNTAIDVGGVPVCTTSTCVTASGSTNYIQNSTTVQTGANINIRASASNTVAAVVQGASGQTSDLLDIESWNGSSATILDSFSANGSLLVQNSSSSILLQADTSNMSVGVNGASTSAGYNLNVTGSINASGTIYDNGAVVCTVGTCAASSGSGNYIQNGTLAQAANFNIQAATSGTVAGTLQANAGGSADILDLKNGAGTITDSFGSTGNLLVQSSTNSSTALAVNNSSGANILDVGTNSTINLVTNGDFEIGPTGWLGGGATIAQTNTVAWQGNNSLTVTTTSANGDAYYTYNSLAANTTYTVSMYAEASGSNISTLNLGYTYNGTSSNICTGLNAVTTGWTRLTCTFTTPNTVSTNNANIYIADSTNSQSFYVDGVQLQLGSSATPFNAGGSVQINGIATSPLSIQNSSDSTTAFQVQNSAGTSNLLVVDTLDNVVGIGAIPLSSGSTLQVGGTVSINTLGANGTSVLCYNSSYQVSSCGSSAGNGNFIFNSSTNQTSANINIQSVNATTATVQLKDITSQTADLIDFVNSSGAIQSEITSGGALQGANASGTNANGGNLNINGGQGTGNGIGGSIDFYTASASSTSGSTLNLLGANPVMNISGSNGAVTLQTASLTDNAFNVQATGGASFLDANTSSSTLVLGQAGVGGTTAWNSTTVLPTASNSVNGSWAANGYLYDIIGTTVYSTPISGNGTIGSWSAISTLPNSSNYGYQVVTNNGYVYVYVDNMVYMGNDNHLYCVNQGIYGLSGSIYYATLNSNGSLGSWSTASTPTSSVQLNDNNGGYPIINASPAYGQFEVYNGNIYFYGGLAEGYINSCSGLEGGAISSTYIASLNGTTGALGSWSTTGNSSLPTAEYSGASATYNGYAYVFGGYNGSSNLSSVDYGAINTNGNIVNWTATTSLPVALDAANAVVYKGYVYIVGGYNGSSASNLVYYAPINSNGTVGGWNVSSGSYDLPQALYSQGTAISGTYIYSVGGYTGSASVTNVYYANFPSNLAASAGANFLDNSFDSTTAFQVQNATSSDVLDLDTTNNRLGINTNAPGGKLDVEVGSSSDVAIIANTAGTGNLLQLENNGVNVASISSTGATTFKNSSNSATAFQIQNSSAINLFSVNTSTSTVLVGNTSSTALASIVDIANSSSTTTAQSVVIGSNSDASNAVSIDTGTGGTLAIGNSATAHTIQVGTGSGIQTLTLGSINTTSSTTIQGGTSAAAVNIQSGASGTINIATSNVANTVQIGSATNAVTQSINIGNNSTASSQNTVTVGSLIGASATTIQAGTGNINIKTTGLSNSGTVFTTQNDSANLLQVQNAQGVNELNIDSVSNVITLGNSINTWNKDWTLNSNSLPATLADGASAAYNGYIYELGGLIGSTGQSAVYYAQQNTNGSLNAWTATTALPVALWNMNTAVAYNGYMYVLGGYSNGTVATVYYAPINANGTLGSWTATTSLPSARYGGAISEGNGYLYYAGGNTGSGPVGTVYYAPINANGTVGAWTTSANSISAEMDAYAAVYNNYLYIFGGSTSGSTYTSAVYIASLNPSTGAVSAFTTSSNPLPAATGQPAFIQNGTTVYDIGGYNGGVTQKVYTATLYSNGTTSGWATSQAPYAATYLMSAVSNNYIYLLGGNNNSGTWSGSGLISSVYYSYVGGLGASLLQQTTGSTTALQVQDINGKDALNVDTTNNRIGVNTSAPGAKLDIETGTSNDVSILANSSGTGSLLQLENAGANVLTVGSTGVTTFENSTNSINGFQIETSSNTSVFNVDTLNTRVGISNNAPGNLLSIGALTTAASGYQIAVTTGGTTNSGIVVQDVVSQSSGYGFMLQDSTGATLASIDYQGNLNVKAATINGNITVNGHIITANASGATTATVQSSAGTGATCTVTGDDTDGQITLTTGTASWASGAQCTINFSSSYSATPNTVMSPTGTTNASSVIPTVTPSTTGFTVNFVVPDSAQHTYTWDYANLN